MDIDLDYMQLAIALAIKAQQIGEVPVGAVVVQTVGATQKVIGKGYNQCIAKHDPSAHAEVVAIRDACLTLQNYRLSNTTLYTTIEPCTMCLGCLIHARINRVVFGATEPRFGAVVSNPMFEQLQFNHRFDYTAGICETEIAELMRAFFQSKR